MSTRLGDMRAQLTNDLVALAAIQERLTAFKQTAVRSEVWSGAQRTMGPKGANTHEEAVVRAAVGAARSVGDAIEWASTLETNLNEIDK